MSVFDGNTPRRNVEPWPEDRVPTNDLERLIASATPYLKKERDEAERAKVDAATRCRAEGGGTNDKGSDLAPTTSTVSASDSDLLINVGLEMAARVCDQQASEPECPERAEYCAAAIRALKRTTSPNKGEAA